jgi:hypothetical protein
VTPFDFVKAINAGRNILDDDVNPDDYVPFIVNKAFSNHIDTILYANDMNMMSQLPVKAQFQYLINTIKPKKRFGWVKSEQNADLELVQNVYQCNKQKARQILSLLSKDELQALRKRTRTGD